MESEYDRMDIVSLPRRNRKMRNIRDLPGDILTDILIRLPFDSLLCCKLVSIKWKNLINHPTFSKNYKEYTDSMSLFTDSNRIFCLRIRLDENKQLTKSLIPRFTVHQLPIECDNNNIFIYTHFSNGIACVQRKNSGVFDFYNLMTGSPALHSVVNSTQPRCSNWWKYYGFGYDAYGDDYKIVLLYSYIVPVDKTQYWVYSFKNQEWKSFTDFPYSAYAVHPSDWVPYSGATTMKGVLHWLVPHKGVIISYDLHTGVFGEIVLPGAGVHFVLQELNDKLCCTYKSRPTNHGPLLFYVWRMVGDSWEMLVSIDCAKAEGSIPCDYKLFNRVRLLMLHESADGRRFILFKVHGLPTLHWYDFVNNKCETLCEKSLADTEDQKAQSDC